MPADTIPEVDCLASIFPCSHTVTGNLLLMVLYGVILAGGAKMIADGSELLLEISNPVIVGGLLLPILGAVPDAAIILVSGLGPDAQQQLSVGVGCLAGSTIMLLTLPWLGGLWLGRCDIRGDEAVEGQCTRFSWTKQGITVDKDVPISARIMILTLVSYFIIQGPSWSGDEGSLHTASLVSMIVSGCLLAAYCIYQVISSMGNEAADRVMAKHQQERKYQAQLHALNAIFSLRQMMEARKGAAAPLLGSTNGDMTPEQKEERNNKLASKFGSKWRAKTLAKANASGSESEGENLPDPVASAVDVESGESQNEEKTPGQILMESMGMMLVGVGLVSIFSDPMCDVLSAITDTRFTGHGMSHIPISPFYVSFVVTPLCSNASELISSLQFASKKKKENISLTYSQLYGAGTMNNTLCLCVFSALVYFKNLTWDYTAEVTVILFVEVVVGIVGQKRTIRLWHGLPVAALYIVSLGIVAIMENVFHIK